MTSFLKAGCFSRERAFSEMQGVLCVFRLEEVPEIPQIALKAGFSKYCDRVR